MNSSDFIEKQLELIEIEKTSEVNESKSLLETCSLARLQAKGLCLLKLKIDSKYTGLYGRTILVLTTAVPGKLINTQHFSSGDIVSVSENSVPPSQLANVKTLISGTVTKVAAQSVSVAIDSDLENLDAQLNDADSYKIIKLSNDITYKRIKTALVALKELKINQRSSHLADVLFQRVRPDQCNSMNLFPNMSADTAAVAYDEISAARIDFFNRNLDQSQQEAVRFTFEQKDLAIIHGPPGTGKTTTLVEIIKQNCLKYKQKILCCAPSNIAVDNLVERLAHTDHRGYAPIRMIRLGHPARLLEHIQKYSLDSMVTQSDQYKLANDIKTEMDQALKTIRKSSTQRGEREGLKRELRELRKELYVREDRAIKDVLNNVDIILATLTTTHPHGPLKALEKEHFDIVIIDECSQALEAACWIPILQGARKLILAGDHLQLPPTIMSKEAAVRGLDLTLMKRLIDAYGDECTRMLTVQYRMNRLINDWISEQLYESRLRPDVSVAEHLLCDLSGVVRNDETSAALVLIDTHGCDMTEMVMGGDDNSTGDEESKANEGEANIVCKHVFNLIDSRIRQEDIAVITPYNLQLELIKAKLHTKFPLVEVKSVDGFQGREKEAIVLSLVRSNSRGEVGFLGDQRRINVAITRARRHLAVVCDSQTCKSNAFLKSFLDYCDKNADMRSGFDYVNENLVVAGGDDDGDNEFEDVTFSKLKVSDKAKKKQSAGKKPQSTGKNDLTSTEEKERQFRDEVTRIINKLDMEKNTEHAFSHDLNSFQRRIVHELAEQFKLYHESRGEAEKRFIVISTRDFNNEKVAAGAVSVQVQAETVNSGFKIEPLLENNEKQKPLAEVKEDTVAQTIGNNKFEVLMDQNTAKGANKNKKQKEGAKQPSADAFLNKKKEDKSATVHLLGELEDQTSSDLKFRSDCRKCVNCDKFILNSNFTMHELHCLKQQTRKQPVDTVLASGSKKSSSVAASSEKTYTAVTKKDKVKKNPIEAAETDDFDTLLDMFQKTNNVCNFVGCKTLVKTLGQNCEFCNFRFCLSHSLAEAHGCGDEAKKQARAHIRKTGNLQVNEKQTSYTQQVKHRYLEKKVHEKIQEMQATRTGANKKKDDK